MATINCINNASAPLGVTGDITVTAGNLLLPTTSSTAGIIKVNSATFVHFKGTSSAFIGAGCGNLTNTGSYNFATGNNALTGITSGTGNIAIGGDGTLYACSTSSTNIAIGSQALVALTTSTEGNNIGIGYGTLGAVTTGAGNVALGKLAGQSASTTASYNIYIGNAGGSESNKIRIGTDGTGAYQQDACYTAGALTSARGITATTGNITSTAGNIGMPTSNYAKTAGIFTINSATFMHANGTRNVFLGVDAGKSANTGSDTPDNVFIGYNAGQATTSTGSNNVYIGSYAGYSATTNGWNTCVGYKAMYTNSSQSGNTCVGYQSLYQMGQGVFNLALGYNAGSAYNTSNASNILLNNDGGAANESNAFRVGAGTGTSDRYINKVYINGIYGYAGTLGATNAGVIIDSAGQIQTTVDASSSATGRTLNFLKIRGTGVITTGDALGQIKFSGHDGTGYIVGSQITSTSSGTIATNRVASDLKFYTHPDSTTASTLRVTVASTGEVTIAAPDSGTGLTVGSGLTVSAGNTTVGTLLVTTVDTNVAAAGVTLAGTTLAADGTDSDINITITPKGTGTIVSTAVYAKAVGATNRAMLVDDSGLIGNATSSRKFKENIEDMGSASSPIMKLRPVSFTYKADPDHHVKHGLIAEEVEEVMPCLVSYDEHHHPYTVSYHELPALLLNEIQKLERRIRELEARLDAKEIQ